MIERIIKLATIVVNPMYASLLALDLPYYSSKELKDAYSSLLEQSKEKKLTSSQKDWLLANTTC